MCSTNNNSSESECDFGIEEEDIDCELADLLQTVDFSKPKPTPEKYDEFEASLNGSEMKVRFVKCKANENKQNDVSDEECGTDHEEDVCDNFTKLMQCSTVVQNQLKRRTGGRITNARCLPLVRSNIKYSGDGSCFGGGMHGQKGGNSKKTGSGPSCCCNINLGDIDGRLGGVTSRPKNKGVEPCYRACEDPKNDVFLVTIGNRKQSDGPRTSIDIELRTPKPPCRDWPNMWVKKTQVEKKYLKGGGKKRGKRRR